MKDPKNNLNNKILKINIKKDLFQKPNTKRNLTID